MKKRMIITIGRQYGSGGREIGKRLAESLGIGYYDKELLAVAAKESGFSKELFEKADERASSGLPYAFSMGFSYLGGMTPYHDVLSNEGLFKIQSDAIRKLAARESCVMIGRCADYVLREDPACLSIFIHNTDENRIRRIMERRKVSADEAKELMRKIDKTRASYYDYYSNKSWGRASSYNLSIDVSVLGVEETVGFLKIFIHKKFDKA
ncbi:AAA family ATPase [Parabacteroides sp. Marseille-P3160]|uniref:cytidylate kinase-like family protein n=2 Tax=Parabacteroides sp. Marseille-P3160 TaxID=1917887 RepID=UPI0009B99DA9|nr:cytidylate kinase-like family protein [Parabacteroides sp. Marseille-P3160]